MKSFTELLAGSAEAHGHLCPGQVVGVRMAMLGCHLIGLDDPQSRDQVKKLIVFVEMDRCAGDAVAYVTGAKLGRRSLKFIDYGIMAATFVNLETSRAYRVLSTEESRDLAHLYAPETDHPREQQLLAYQRMPLDVLFRVQEVVVDISQYDLPGPTRRKVACRRCGQVVRDGREVEVAGEPWCRPCAHGGYFTPVAEVVACHRRSSAQAALAPAAGPVAAGAGKGPRLPLPAVVHRGKSAPVESIKAPQRSKPC